MKESLSNGKYTKAEVRIDPMAREVTRNRLDSRNRGHFMNNSPRQNYRGNRFRGNTRGYSRQDDRGNYRNEGYNNYNRDRNRLRERNFTRNYNNQQR